MPGLPSGTVTFLFTDIEGSTKLAQEQRETWEALRARHHAILRAAIESNNGYVFQIIGDAFCAAFHTGGDAINAAIKSQVDLQAENWGDAPIRVRMGIHTGKASVQENGDYVGYMTLSRVQRLMSAGHGGQVLLSLATEELVHDELTEGLELSDRGEWQLKGLIRPMHIYQLVIPDLHEDFSPLRSTLVATLPSDEATSLLDRIVRGKLIGRERELVDSQAKLTSARLLTLIGPGGTGKTRLSLQIALDQLAFFKDGVWLVELAPLRDPGFIISTIASVFDVREIQNIPLMTLVLDYLRAKELLLVLDNCEHLVEASAQIADQLLHNCPNIKIITSSREALGIDGETVYRVPSLKDDESTRLFTERATKAEPRFQVTDENASFIAQICSRLDGIPLAIELAAARVKLLSPEQIAARLDDRFRLLTGGSRTALPRQQTLRALIDWSYQSLNEVEPRALHCLAAFSGGWSFEAAEAVIGESEAMNGLLGLVHKSLVNVEEQDGASRYRFLETIRQYAMEKLVESGEAVAVRDRHLEYVLNLAEQSQQGIFGTEITESLDRIEVEHDTLRAALEWATGNRPEKALKLAYAVGAFGLYAIITAKRAPGAK